MPETTQKIATAGIAPNNASNEMLSTMQELGRKVSGLESISSGVARSVESLNTILSDNGSAYFQSLTNSLMSTMNGIEADRRVYESALKQNEAASRSSKSTPERGQPGYWDSVYSTQPVDQSSMYEKAIKGALKDDDIKKMLSDTLGSATVKTALKSDVDDRTFREKTFDFLGLGGINRAVNWFGDRDVRKINKENAKDQKEIKRETKTVDRLKAKYQRAKEKGADDEELGDIREELLKHTGNVRKASERLDARNVDPFADLTEKKGDVFSEQAKALLPSNPSAAFRESAIRGNDIATRPIPQNPVIAPELPVRKFDDSEPVELSKNPNALKTPVGDAKELNDIQRNLDTRVRPEFYAEGTKFFKEALSGHISTDGVNGFGPIPSKTGLYAALGAATIASLAKIIQAGTLIHEFVESSAKTRDTINKSLKENNAALDTKKRGYNDKVIESDKNENEARANLSKVDASVMGQYEQTSIGQMHLSVSKGFDKYVVKPLYKFMPFLESLDKWGTKKLRESGIHILGDRAEASKQLYDAVQKSKQEHHDLNRFTEYAKNTGIDIKDREAMNLAYDKWKRHRLAAGNSMEPEHVNENTPGINTRPENVENADEYARRLEEATYNGTKRALMDSDVQRQNEENAKIQGRQINESLVGRK